MVTKQFNSLNDIQSLEDLYDFFDQIPANQWCQGSFECNGKHCALGHLEKLVDTGHDGLNFTFALAHINKLLPGIKNRLSTVNDYAPSEELTKVYVLQYIQDHISNEER